MNGAGVWGRSARRHHAHSESLSESKRIVMAAKLMAHSKRRRRGERASDAVARTSVGRQGTRRVRKPEGRQGRPGTTAGGKRGMRNLIVKDYVGSTAQACSQTAGGAAERVSESPTKGPFLWGVATK